MLELNFYNVVLLPTVALISYAVWSRLRQSPEYRHLSSHVPSVTKSLWAELRFSWIIGTTHPKDLLSFFLDLIRKNGPVIHFNLAGRAYVLLTDPDDLKVLLSSKQNIDKGPEYELLQPWLNDGLLLSSGEKWQNRRKLLTSTFHFKTLHMYNGSLNKNARLLAEKLLEATENDKEISVMKYAKLCSLDMICETIMGTEMKTQEGKSVEYVNTIKNICRSLVDRIFKFWLWNDLIFTISKTGQIFYKSVKVVHEYTDNVIKKKQTNLNDEKNASSENGYEIPQKKSFLDILLSVLDENPDQMTDMDIREEVDTFLFEGYDTTSTAITMTLLMLGLHQDVQDRARDELRSIFADDSDRDVTMEDLSAMKYIDAVIKETLRLYPSVPGISRKIRETLVLKNYSIPPNTVVSIYPYIIHRNEEIYPNAEEFNPERFLDEANKSKFLFAYLPFSAGPRNCIGQKYAVNELKMVVSNVLRKAKIETLGKKEDIQVRLELILGVESIPKMKFIKL